MDVRFQEVPPDVMCRMATAEDGWHISRKDWLSDEERKRMETFGNATRRDAFALGRILLKELVADVSSRNPEDVLLKVAPGGRIEVPDSSYHLSLSHAGHGDHFRSFACLAERAVGVDVEEIVPRRSDLYERILHPDELSLFDVLELPHNEAQLLLWSLKEAVLKGLGTGFRRAAKTVHVDGLRNGSGLAHVGDGPSWTLRYMRQDEFWMSLAYVDQ